MEYSLRSNRRDLQRLTGIKMPQNTSMNPPAHSETNFGYFSVNGSSDSGYSESNYDASDTMSVSDWSKDSPPYFQEQSVRSDTMSVSDWSRDSPPYFREQSVRENNTTTSSTRESSKAALKTDEFSPVKLVVFLVVVATVLYCACNLFSREMSVNQDVKIVLQSSSGEVAKVIDEQLTQIMKQLKQVMEIRVLVEIQANGDPRQATDKAESFGFVFLVKFCFLILTILFIIAIFSDTAR